MFRANADLIRVVEIEPQTLWTKGTAPGALPRGSAQELRVLATLPQHRLTHGVGYPIGGTICDQQRHIDEFRCWTQLLGAPWTSEHLSILEVPGASGPQACGFLMPPLQTDAQVALAAANIRRRAAAIGRPFAFETGVNYFAPRKGEMADGAFFAAIAEAADCGILLDLNNLWVNAGNGRADIADVVARLPLDRIWEVHLAGAEFAHDHWLDAHSGAIDPDLAMLAADIVADLPNLGAIIFEIAPDRTAKFGAAAFLREMTTLHRLWERTREKPRPTADTVATITSRGPADTGPVLRTAAVPNAAQTPATSVAGLAPAEWERLIAAHMLPPSHRPTAPAQPLTPADERTFALYLRLVASFRRGAISDLLRNSIRLLLLAIGEPALCALLDRYAAAVPPSAFPSDEALGFRWFVEATGMSVPGLTEMLAFEAASIEAAADSRTVRVTLARDLGALLDDIAAGRIPAPAPDGPAMVLDIGVDPAPLVRLVECQDGPLATSDV